MDVCMCVHMSFMETETQNGKLPPESNSGL